MPKEVVNVSVVQMDVAWLDPERNRQKMVQSIEEEVKQGGVDLIVFPELANSGYVKPHSEREFVKKYFACAEPIPGPTTEALGEAASKHSLHVIAGILQIHPEIPATLYNSAVLIGPDGKIIGIHHKLHIPGNEKHYFCPGNTMDVYQTEIGAIGILICYDYLFPEVCRVLALKGAEILCLTFASVHRVPSSPVTSLEHGVACRARENKLFVIGCNRVGSEDELTFFGRSAIANPCGEVIALGKEKEEDILRAKLRLEQILEERAFYPVFRDRRPELYTKLCDPL